MARRGKKNKGGKKTWSFSLTSIFSLFYALYTFKVIDLVMGIFSTSNIMTYLQQGVGVCMNAFKSNWLSVAMVTIQFKLLGFVMQKLGMGNIGRFWKLNLRW